MIFLHGSPSNISLLAKQLQARRDQDMQLDSRPQQLVIGEAGRYEHIEQEIIAKCLQSLEEVCQQLKSYLC